VVHPSLELLLNFPYTILVPRPKRELIALLAVAFAPALIISDEFPRFTGRGCLRYITLNYLSGYADDSV
jgi:hypothetical protein